MNFEEIVLTLRPKPKPWKGESFKWIEPKFDGHRMTIIKTDKKIFAIGRKIRLCIWDRIQNYEPLKLATDLLPDFTVVDGELWCPGKPSSHVPTALNDSTGYVFTAFALPWFAGVRQRGSNKWSHLALMARLRALGYPTPQPNKLRLEGLSEPSLSDSVIGMVFARGLKAPCEGLVRSPTRNRGTRVPVQGSSAGRGQSGGPDGDPVSFKTVHEALCTLAIAEGLEGFVLKSSHWDEWYKVKPTRTMDCIVVGIKPGQSKYEGMIGSLILMVYNGDELIYITNCSGLTDEQRAWNEEDCIGKVCEIAYDGVMARGGLRFPRFLRWRDDKPASECRIEQIK